MLPSRKKASINYKKAVLATKFPSPRKRVRGGGGVQVLRSKHHGGCLLERFSSEARISDFLYGYRLPFLASRPHKPSTHFKKEFPETDPVTDMEPG